MEALGDRRKTKDLIASIERVCEAHGRRRVNGAVASERTFRMQMDVMKQFARTLHEAGLMLEDIGNLGEKHVDKVFDVWVIDRGLSPKTLQNQKSRVKQFLRWLGKPQLAEHVSAIETRYKDRLPEGFRVRSAAEKSKSWRGNEVELEDLFRRALALDARFGAILMLERAFGLRKKEALLVNPWSAGRVSEHFEVRENIAKGGRYRLIELRGGEYGEMQRQVLKFAKQHCKRWENMAWPDCSLEQAERRYYHLCMRVGLTKAHSGMTGHGLRAGFAEDMMLLRKVLPPVLGGTREMSHRYERLASKLKASDAMGHNRPKVTHAYYGKDTRFACAGTLLGYRFGNPMNMGTEAKAQLWVSEMPVALEGEPGRYFLPDEAAELAYVTVQLLNDEQEIDRQSLGQFLEEHPVAVELVVNRLDIIGLQFTDE